MALEYYKIINLSNDTKLFTYNSGSSGSPGDQFTITTQGLNSEVIVQSFYPPINIPIGVSEGAFTSPNFSPNQPGYAWLWNDGNKVKYIKINHTSTNDFNISPYISDTRIISFAMIGARNGAGNFMYNPTGSQHVEDYYLSNSTKRGSHSFLVVEQSPSSNAVSDLTAGQRNFNFECSGSYNWYATSSGNIDNPVSASSFTSSLAQGYFPKNIEDFGTTQIFRGWAGANYYIGGNLVSTDGNLIDHLGNFNTGSTERDMDGISSNPNQFFPYTASNVPWFINSPTSSIHIPSSTFGTYTNQPNSFKFGPSYRNTSSESPYGEAVYGDPIFEYGGSGADDFISYYYREDTNEILVYDPSNILNEDKNASPLYYPNARYHSVLVGVGQPKIYTTAEGHDITVGNGNELIVFRGQQSVGTGDTNAWNYNRYLHKPYKIYFLTVTGSNDNPARIVDAYVSFSSSLANERRYDGAYTFETNSQTDLSLTASINLTASNALPNPPSNYGDGEYGEDAYGGNGSTPDNQTWQTASLDLFLADPNQGVGSLLTSSVLHIDDINADNSISLKAVISSSMATPGVSLRLAVTVNTGSPDFTPNVNSSLIVTDYSMSIAGPVPDISDIVPTYLDNILLVPDNCNPYEGSALSSATNNVVMDVDYSSGSTPVNFKQILEQKAKKSEIPASHYSTYGIAGPRYDGSKTESNRLNKFTEGDSGTYGKLPVAEINKAYAGYFNRIFDPYPLINNKTNFEIKYIIDENGNASQPRVGEYSFYNLEGSLSEKDNVKISVVDKLSEILYPLNSFKNIYKTGQSVTPILHSQVAALAYTSSIFVTGKVPLSDDPIEFKDLSFRAFENVPSARVKSFSQQQLSPETLITGSGENVIVPYTSSEMGTGTPGDCFIPRSDISGSQGAGQGKPTSDEYTYRVNYTFETSRINRTKTRNGKKGVPGKSSKSSPDVGDFKMFIKRNGVNTKLQLESLYADVIHRNPNNSSGVETKSFNVLNTVMYNGGLNQMDIHMQSDNVFRIHFNNDRFNSAVASTGTDGTDIRLGGSLIKVRWRIKLKARTNSSGFSGIFGSNATPIKQGDLFQTFVEGALHHSTTDDYRQSYFFYSTTTGEYPGSADINISLEGTKSLPSPAINSQYWAFTGSTEDMIEMVSPNGNIAYGRVGFRQQYMEYGESGSYPPPISGVPADQFHGSFNTISGSEGDHSWRNSYVKNPDFVGGKEPNFLKFPPVRNDWEVFPGDEIRFNNDEDQVYKIINVVPPITSTPIHPDEEIGRLKLQLDREVNSVADLNFFLIRRFVKDEGNIIVDFPKPYGIPLAPNTATGLMFPEFPVKELNTNPDEVLRNLLEQKLIE
tara:strand:+ start:9833 stop:13882 length:4050 start_codon:yes stop_codon:yes gene_type:complete